MPMIVTRKIIPMGSGGLVVAIPKGWARYFKLKAGYVVEVKVNRQLSIRPIGAKG